MVKNFSEDNINNTIEFNEFLKMMSKQNEEEIKLEMLEEAFTYVAKHLCKICLIIFIVLVYSIKTTTVS